ncbi:DUF7619 domain-containing protein [Chryseobacterium ginsenosidimutans]|uniref:DUF7619 domain-containing protein n=1 Tax=Chryseobacterium ginsenosidimutans TaxID=687846 RepID=UPI0027BA927D|nr:T9SS type A sorting domain-containing protein [Chryseobacterium ginsenosidimutans]
MKTKLFCLLAFLMLSLGLKAQIINFPDANFKAKLLSSSASSPIAQDFSGNYFAIDANGDGQIQQSEADLVGTLVIISNNNNNPIQNYQGILSFRNIKTINIDYYNSPNNNINISDLDFLENVGIVFQGASGPTPGVLSINNCLNLKTLRVNTITLQNLTNTPAIKNVELSVYSNGGIQNILNDLGNLTKLENIKLYTSGTYNMATPTGVLNLSYHPFLKEVDIDYLKLSELNLSHCNLLDTVNINMGYTLPNVSPNYFGSLDVSYCPSLTAIDLTGDSNIGSLIANNCTNLQSIDCESEFLGNFSANNCPLLDEIKLMSFSSLNTFQMANCPNLKNIWIEKYGNDSFDATNAVNLEHLYLGSPWYYPGYNTNFFGSLQNLTISNNLKLKSLRLRNHKITQLNINGLPKLENIAIELAYSQNTTYTPQPDFATEFLQSVNIQNCPLLTSLVFPGQKGLKNITVKNCASLASLEHTNSGMAYPEFGELKTVDIQDCAALSSVSLGYNKINDFKLKNTEANIVDISNNELTNFELLNNNNLTTILASRNKFANLNLSTLPTNLQILDSSFNLITAITGTSSSIKNLDISNNNLTDFNINNLPNLETLTMGRNKIVDVDFSGHTKIKTIYEFDYSNYFGSPGFTNPSTFTKTFNVNNCSNLETVILESSSLEKVFAKNGVNEGIYFQMTGNYPNLQYICCDASQITDLQASLAMDGIVCSVNDYCNFVPGGNYNTIKGTVKFDENNNSCDTNDKAFEHLKLKISNGTTTSETFVKSNGEYNLYNSQAGNYTVTAEAENPTLFTISPSTFTTNFADNNNNISTQNLCVTKNGNIKDLEVVFAPVTDARPGFNAVYKFIWRNKGNTTLSGNTSLSFDTSKMSFVSSVLPSSVTGNLVTFNFTNLKPYQNTSSEITFTINTPTNPTNPVNNGDILNFTAGVNPVLGDANPDDNQFVYKQTVVGSFDPNDITCLEGNLIPLSMVGKYLHYIVNFENTGTAPATNIVVEMDINPDDFDINTLQLQNTSHNTYTKITGNKVEFVMKDINLAATAHGNVVLKIKSKNNLVSGDSVINKANIYFDYNFPVITNEATTNIVNSTLSTSEIRNGNSSINVYPNPTKGDVNIKADLKIKTVEVYDTQGRIIQKQIGINAQNTKISLQNMASGMYILKIVTDREVITKKVLKN